VIEELIYIKQKKCKHVLDIIEQIYERPRRGLFEPVVCYIFQVVEYEPDPETTLLQYLRLKCILQQQAL